MATPGQQDIASGLPTPIGEISRASDGITITARVVNKSSLRVSRVPWSFAECLDASGEIKCVAFGEKAKKLQKAKVNEEYTITDLRAQEITEEARRKFRIVLDHKFELVLTENSKIIEHLSCPHREYNFEKIQQLKHIVPAEGNEKTVDVIGVCVSVGRLEQANCKRRQLILVDDSTGVDAGNGIPLTLWNQQAEEIEENGQRPFVVIAKRATLRNYCNRAMLNSGDSNMIQINPPLSNLGQFSAAHVALMTWFDTSS